MKSSVVLSICLDVAGVALILVPDAKFASLSPSRTLIRIGKCACSVALLLAGFLVDRFITHG
jgi:hypothetical protein